MMFITNKSAVAKHRNSYFVSAAYGVCHTVGNNAP